MDQEPSPATQAPLDDMRCPTCGARQALAEICRRCKCDLSLTVAAHRRRSQLRTRCLVQLRAGQPDAALRAANELHALAPDADSIRLLAIAHLLHGDYAAAVRTLVGRP